MFLCFFPRWRGAHCGDLCCRELSTEEISVKKRVGVDFYSARHISCKWQQLDIKQGNCIIKQGDIKRPERVNSLPLCKCKSYRASRLSEEVI